MKLATWNVNSLKVRLPHVLAWLAENPVDVLCLQELKMDHPVFPLAEIEAAGYRAVWYGQKTYNGVAILTRAPLEGEAVVTGIPGFEDEQRRVIAATVNGVRVICAYVVNGEAVGSAKFEYKMAWLAALERYVAEELARHPALALLGDYNIAPEDRDVYDPEAWHEKVLCSTPERAAFQRLCALGLSDAFRLFNQEDKQYSWWDYRAMMFRRNLGLRIDHILITEALKARAAGCEIDRTPRKWERPSDHTPVVLTLSQ
ncbi:MULTISPECIES: exodeoxyribonuclease III [Gulbenkiania]|uniref:Exodeoxyribonuclease III n=2 Tax=Gulbenkiania TaxID=397456 RepID=A0A0K6GT47_9NEIS|nr:MULTISPECIES: exodeoxyribonuclease III [Gulbenkiania]TCW31682.1 exodeoxyribonuclease-3 [Gulbenkiania mobilis]CUA81807.1 exodeoxyribonuclease III [Gulbenkiania indica]